MASGGPSRNEESVAEQTTSVATCDSNANNTVDLDGAVNDIKTSTILHGLYCDTKEVKDLLEKIKPLIFNAEELFGQKEYKASLKKYIQVCGDIFSWLQRWEGGSDERLAVRNTVEALISRAEKIKSLCAPIVSELHKCLEEDMNRDVHIGYADSVCGPQDVIDFLKERVVLHYRFPNLVRQSGPLLLYGYPGTGKSHLLEATAQESNVKLFVFNLYCLAGTMYRQMGSAIKCMKAVFEVARNNRPCILCLEDVEMLCENDEVYRQGKCETMVQMCPVKRDTNEGVTVIGVTQRPWKLDASLRRRFLRKHVSLPTAENCIKILKMSLKNTTHTLDQDFWAEIGRRTEGYTGSDLVLIARTAMMTHIRSVTQAKYFKKIMLPSPVVDDTVSKPENTNDSPQTEDNLVNTNSTEMSNKSEASDEVPPVKDCGEHCEQYENQPDCIDDQNSTQLSAIRTGATARSDTNNDQLDEDNIENVKYEEDNKGNNKNCDENERFTPCTEKDEGAIKMTFLDIDADKIWTPTDVTEEDMLTALSDTRPSIADDEIARMMSFIENFEQNF